MTGSNSHIRHVDSTIDIIPIIPNLRPTVHSEGSKTYFVDESTKICYWSETNIFTNPPFSIVHKILRILATLAHIFLYSPMISCVCDSPIKLFLDFKIYLKFGLLYKNGFRSYDSFKIWVAFFNRYQYLQKFLKWIPILISFPVVPSLNIKTTFVVIQSAFHSNVEPIACNPLYGLLVEQNTIFHTKLQCNVLCQWRGRCSSSTNNKGQYTGHVSFYRNVCRHACS